MSRDLDREDDARDLRAEASHDHDALTRAEWERDEARLQGREE